MLFSAPFSHSRPKKSIKNIHRDEAHGAKRVEDAVTRKTKNLSMKGGGQETKNASNANTFRVGKGFGRKRYGRDAYAELPPNV